MNTLLSIAPIALLVALVAVPIYYAIYRYAPGPKKEVSVVRYVLVVLAVGAVAYLIGTIVGIVAACSPSNAGNLCGLFGVFGVGPLLAAVAILMYAHFWAKNARQAH